MTLKVLYETMSGNLLHPVNNNIDRNSCQYKYISTLISYQISCGDSDKSIQTFILISGMGDMLHNNVICVLH